MMEDSTPAAQWQLLEVANGKTFNITADTSVGRDEQADVRITAGNPSRRHATIYYQADGLFIEDLQSTNGTFVNGERIAEKRALQHGDSLRFDSTDFSLQNLAAVAAPLAAAAADSDKTQFSAAPVAAVAAVEKAAPAAPAVEVVAAQAGQAPPSWALERSKSVDNTHIMSDTMIGDLKRRKVAKEAAAKVSVPTLLGKSAPIAEKSFALALQDGRGEWEVGRSEQCHIRIDDPSISTQHAQIVHENNKWKVVDAMSANGTYVNGEKGLSSYLVNGDIIRFGSVECQLLIPIVAAAPKPAPIKKQAPKTALIAIAVAAVVIIAAVAGFLLK